MEIFFAIVNVIKYLIYILLLLIVLIFIYLNVAPVFGGSPDKETQKTIENSEYFVEGKFRNIKTNYTNFRSTEKKPPLKIGSLNLKIKTL